jgi:hypothetical protein
MNQHRVISIGGDVISASAILGYLAGALPAIAAISAIVWYAIQVYESKTVQRHVRLRRLKKIKARREAAASQSS